MTGHLATLPADEVPWRLAGALVAGHGELEAVSVAVLLRLVAAGRVTPGVGRDAQRGGSGGTRSTRSVVASSS